jgi:hypothetical protein
MGEWGDWVLQAMARAMTYGEKPELPDFVPVAHMQRKRRRRKILSKSCPVVMESVS